MNPGPAETEADMLPSDPVRRASARNWWRSCHGWEYRTQCASSLLEDPCPDQCWLPATVMHTDACVSPLSLHTSTSPQWQVMTPTLIIMQNPAAHSLNIIPTKFGNLTVYSFPSTLASCRTSKYMKFYEQDQAIHCHKFPNIQHSTLQKIKNLLQSLRWLVRWYQWADNAVLFVPQWKVWGAARGGTVSECQSPESNPEVWTVECIDEWIDGWINPT